MLNFIAIGFGFCAQLKKFLAMAGVHINATKTTFLVLISNKVF